VCGVCVVVYVHNAGNPMLYDMTSVRVNVLDINDHAPVFEASASSSGPLTNLEVPENAQMSAIHTLEVYDADDGINAQVSYHITGATLKMHLHR